MLVEHYFCKENSSLGLKMPIKDITNEEKSMLYMVGRKPVEINKITEARLPGGAVTDSTKMLMSDANSFTGSFTWSEIGVQTEVHYE